MQTVGIRELKAHASEIIRRVQAEGQPIDITLRGEVVARIVPVTRSPEAIERARAAMSQLKQLAAEIGARNLPAIDVSTLMQDERR